LIAPAVESDSIHDQKVLFVATSWNVCWPGVGAGNPLAIDTIFEVCPRDTELFGLK
jgi:hypothetical protein